MINPADPETKHVAEQMAELLLQKQLWPRCETKHAIDPAADGAGPDSKHVRRERLVSICSRRKRGQRDRRCGIMAGSSAPQILVPSSAPGFVAPSVLPRLCHLSCHA